jgi:hypothetical protein
MHRHHKDVSGVKSQNYEFHTFLMRGAGFKTSFRGIRLWRNLVRFNDSQI